VEITDPVSGDIDTFNARAKSAGIDFHLDGSNAEVESGDKRREKVTLESCNNCHRNLTAHGSNRNDSVLACLTCHNPNATDIGDRPTLDDPTAVTPDGKIEESINFGWMIHSIHAESRVFADLDAAVDIRYPQSPGNCLACHTSEGFFPVLGLDRLGTTIITASTLGDGMGGAGIGVIDDNPLNDVKMTPDAAACGACHLDESDPNDPVELHFEQNGGSLNACQLDDGTFVRNALDPTDPNWADGCQPDPGVVYLEFCTVCHDPGSVLGADVVHPLIE
jgi:OmcA/MtrC family decaheme c-type cytochrome